MNVIARNLVELIKRSGMTHEDVAMKLGVGRTTISNYTTGYRKPDSDTIKKLCKVLDCTYEDLLGPLD